MILAPSWIARVSLWLLWPTDRRHQALTDAKSSAGHSESSAGTRQSAVDLRLANSAKPADESQRQTKDLNESRADESHPLEKPTE
jgi:hypothetical protein